MEWASEDSWSTLKARTRRPLPDIDLSRTIGWFTALFPVILDSSGDLPQRIKRIKESLRQMPKGLGYGLFNITAPRRNGKLSAVSPKRKWCSII
jgi:hypothetical protein